MRSQELEIFARCQSVREISKNIRVRNVSKYSRDLGPRSQDFEIFAKQISVTKCSVDEASTWSEDRSSRQRGILTLVLP